MRSSHQREGDGDGLPEAVAQVPIASAAKSCHGLAMNRSAPARTTAPHRLGDRLHREWSHLRSRPAAVRHAAGWAIVEGPLRDLDQVLLAVGYEVAWTPHNDAALRRLVGQAAHDLLAARVVIQRILPGLLAVARRRVAVDGVLDELIGAAWIAVRTFNPVRRPSCMAAALIADADYRAFRMGWRRGSCGEQPIGLVADDLAGDDPGATPEQILAGVLELAAESGVPEADIDLIRRLAGATPTHELATILNVTPRTVRNRRDRITDRLRDLALAA
jgi:hypothetical protein